MGGTPARLDRPAVFLKPTSSVILQPRPIVRPAAVAELHHEVELALVIGRRCARLPPGADWRPYVRGYRLALDMTSRDLQAAAKKAGMPWFVAKGFDTFCPLSDEIPAARVANAANLELYLRVDGVERQRGSTAGMLHK